MKLIKLKTSEGWISLYQSILNACLKKNKNLADIENREEARKNLELTGDNNHTHYHDDRYVPMITQLEDKLMAEYEQMRNELTVQIKNLTSVSSSNSSSINQKVDTDLFVFGDVAPVEPKEHTIWFNIKGNGEACIKVWYNGEWTPMGAVWK